AVQLRPWPLDRSQASARRARERAAAGGSWWQFVPVVLVRLTVENVGPGHETEPEHRRAGAESVPRHLDVEHPPALSIEPRCVRQLRLDGAHQTGGSIDLHEPLLAIGRNRLGDCHHNTPDGRDGARGWKILR